jgi:hypothetical protein
VFARGVTRQDFDVEAALALLAVEKSVAVTATTQSAAIAVENAATQFGVLVPNLARATVVRGKLNAATDAVVRSRLHNIAPFTRDGDDVRALHGVVLSGIVALVAVKRFATAGGDNAAQRCKV